MEHRFGEWRVVVMVDNEVRTNPVRKWRHLWWEYSIVNGGLELYVELRGGLWGSRVSVRHDWSKWKLIVWLYAAALVIMTIVTIWTASTQLEALGASQACMSLTILYLAYAVVAYTSLMLVYNTLAASRAFKKRRTSL